MNCSKTLNCISLLEYFLLASPPLNKVPIPRIKTTPTAIKNVIDKTFTIVNSFIVLKPVACTAFFYQKHIVIEVYKFF